MKKGQTCTGTVIRTDYPNKGIVEIRDTEQPDNKITCVAKNALPGQTVELTVTKKRGDRLEGRIDRVVERAPGEIPSPCPHFDVCGGCTYLTLPYEETLKLKEAQMKRLLDGVLIPGQGTWDYEGILPAPSPFGYRNKMEFSFGDAYKDGPLALGLHKRGSFYDIVPVTECRIVDEDYRSILSFTGDYFRGLPYYHRTRHEGFLRHLLVRKSARTGEILVALVTSSEMPDKDLLNGRSVEGWKDGILNLNLTNNINILHMINDSVADTVRADEMKILHGRDYIEEELLGMRFRISVFSFFQTNTLSAEVLYGTVRRFITREDKITDDTKTDLRGKTVYDLYSGTGTIAQMLSPIAGEVIGVEIVEEAVRSARENATLNGLTNCSFIAGDVLKVLDEIEDKPDYIVLDPPRDGINPKALKRIISYGVPQLIYISCKPTSLVRDLTEFLEAGYRVERVAAVDQFPWTSHCEVIAKIGLDRKM